MTNAVKMMTYAAAGLYDRVREELEELIKRGELKENEKKLLFDALDKREAEVQEHHRFRDLQAKLDTAVQELSRRLPAMTSQREMQDIRAQLGELATRLETLEANVPAGVA
jgi:polyhydroxyalkanoate synthesis regulator phasin